MKNYNFMPLLVLALAGAVVAKTLYTYNQGGGFNRRTTPEQKIANLRSQMQTAFAEGDTKKYIDLQTQIEMIDLESGL